MDGFQHIWRAWRPLGRKVRWHTGKVSTSLARSQGEVWESGQGFDAWEKTDQRQGQEDAKDDVYRYYFFTFLKVGVSKNLFFLVHELTLQLNKLAANVSIQILRENTEIWWLWL